MFLFFVLPNAFTPIYFNSFCFFAVSSYSMAVEMPAMNTTITTNLLSSTS